LGVWIYKSMTSGAAFRGLGRAPAPGRRTHAPPPQPWRRANQLAATPRLALSFDLRNFRLGDWNMSFSGLGVRV
jgi:hypothetical protein